MNILIYVGNVRNDLVKGFNYLEELVFNEVEEFIVFVKKEIVIVYSL